MWSKHGDTILSPFAGIGSEGFEAVKNKRKFIGIELKKSYYDQCVLNMQAAEKESESELLFTWKPYSLLIYGVEFALPQNYTG